MRSVKHEYNWTGIAIVWVTFVLSVYTWHTYVNQVSVVNKNMYKDKAVKTLLSKVNIQKTRGDGHCFLYAVCDSWSKQLPFKNTLDLLLKH